MLTLLNWFHISLDVVFSRISISSLSLWEEARWLWECRMLSSVNLDHESGRESLSRNIVDSSWWRLLSCGLLSLFGLCEWSLSVVKS